jgi:AcrR family transcriptional regulator
MSATISTRDRIVREATRLFADQGIKATTVAQIEQAVGLRKGSGGVHRYFATKNDLVRAVFDAQLEKGREQLSAATELPTPAADQVRGHLEAIGRIALTKADESREVALIMLRDAHNLPPGLLDEQHTKNFELTYESAANALRDLQAAQGSDSTIDADALGYLFLAPLIYFRLIEWATNRRILDLDDDRLLAAWTTVFEPIFASLLSPPRDADAGTGLAGAPAGHTREGGARGERSWD